MNAKISLLRNSTNLRRVRNSEGPTVGTLRKSEGHFSRQSNDNRRVRLTLALPNHPICLAICPPSLSSYEIARRCGCFIVAQALYRYRLRSRTNPNCFKNLCISRFVANSFTEKFGLILRRASGINVFWNCYQLLNPRSAEWSEYVDSALALNEIWNNEESRSVTSICSPLRQSSES